MNVFEKGLLKYFTKSQLQKIQATKIGIAGCGGIGSNIANALVRSGFVDYEIIDPDRIEPSNLNRQNYFINEIGRLKIDVLAKTMEKVNPNIKVKKINKFLSKNNISKYFNDRDVVFEAFDNVVSKKLFLETFGNSNKLIIMCSGMAGVKNKTIKNSKIRPNVIIIGDGVTEAGKSDPPLAPRVIECAAKMASVALEFVLSNRKPGVVK